MAGHGQSGGHSWSKDGFRWSNVTAAYNNSVAFDNGDYLNCNGFGRQRPKLLLNASGIPTYLYSGCACKQKKK